jgi:hypothetical protein
MYSSMIAAAWDSPPCCSCRTTRPMQCTETSSGVPRMDPGIRIVNSIRLSTPGRSGPVNKIPFAEILSVVASSVPPEVSRRNASFIGNRTAVRNGKFAKCVRSFASCLSNQRGGNCARFAVDGCSVTRLRGPVLPFFGTCIPPVYHIVPIWERTPPSCQPTPGSCCGPRPSSSRAPCAPATSSGSSPAHPPASST